MSYDDLIHRRYWLARQNESPAILEELVAFIEYAPQVRGWIDHGQLYSSGFCFDTSLLRHDESFSGHFYGSDDYADSHQGSSGDAVTVEVHLSGRIFSSADQSLHRVGYRTSENLQVATWWVDTLIEDVSEFRFMWKTFVWRVSFERLRAETRADLSPSKDIES